MKQTSNKEKDTKIISITIIFALIICSLILALADSIMLSNFYYVAYIPFLYESIINVLLFIGIIVTIVFAAKKKIRAYVPIVTILIFIIWALTSASTFISCVHLTFSGSSDETQIVENFFHFNVVYYEQIHTVYDEIGNIDELSSYDYYFPYINLVANILVTLIVMPVYIKEKTLQKSEKENI